MLPLLLGPSVIPSYSGYDDTVDPSISNAFSTAAFRFGHTMLSPQLRRLDPMGSSIPAGDLALRDAFFNIQWIQDEGVDSILRGLMTQPAQELDAFIIDDVRSFLFAPVPGSPGSDLAALNMQRGREHGLPSYNATRTALGLTPATTFADITSDTALQSKLSTAYSGDIDAVDLWIAGLAEDKVADAMVGETFHAILLDIDHSPDKLLHERHADFYAPAGLRKLTAQLYPGGVFALWSDDPPEAGFLQRLQAVFKTVRAEVVKFPNPFLHRDSESSVYVCQRDS